MIGLAIDFAIALVLLVAAGAPTAYVLTRRPLLSAVLAPLVTALTASLGAILMLLVGGRMIWWTGALIVAQYAAAPLLIRRTGGMRPLPYGSRADVFWYVAPLVPPFTMVLAPPVQFDANSIWWLHAIYLSKSADVARTSMAGPLFFNTHPDYPPLASAPVGVIFNVLGYELRLAQFTSSVITFAAIAMLSYAVRAVTAGTVTAGAVTAGTATAGGVRTWISRLAGVLVALSMWGQAEWGVAGGMSDAPWTAAFVAGAVLLLLRDRPFGPPLIPAAVPLLLLSVAALTKNEGLVAVVVVAALVLVRERRHLRRALLVAVPVLAGAAWSVVARLVGAKSDLADRFPLLFTGDIEILDRLGPSRAAVQEQVGRAVVLGLVVAVLGAVFLGGRRRALKIGSDLWLWIVIGVYTTVLLTTYVVSPYDLKWHLPTSIDRATLPILVMTCASVAVWGATAASRHPTSITTGSTHPPGTTNGSTTNGSTTTTDPETPATETIVKLSILMPVFNEEARLAGALKQALDVEYPCDVELVVVDDGSADGTGAILSRFSDARLRIITHERNAGKGAAIRTAVDNADGDVMVVLDADLEYDPQDIAKLLRPVLDGHSSVVYGNRTFGSHSAFSFWYVMGNRAVTTFANVLFNCYIGDLETCYKLMPIELYRAMNIRSKGFGMEAEITGKLLRRGIRPYEVPVSYRARTREEGKKITWKDGVEAVWILARERIRPVKREQPHPTSGARTAVTTRSR
jgi:dolichol-phosphate hexosyltransferase